MSRAKGRGRDDADVTVRDVDALRLERLADGTHAGGCCEKMKNRGEGRAHAHYADSAYYACARRGRDDDDVVAGSGEVLREILQVELDAADSRVIPVADECDFHSVILSAFMLSS
jgi:hypothetical protein